MLPPLESFWLRWHSEHSPAPFDQTARAALLADAGASPAAIAEALGLPEAEAAHRLETYAANRLSDFPRPRLTLEETLAAAQVDGDHARQTAQLAGALFDATRSLHRLPASLRPLLQTASWLHDVGFRLDEAQHHLTGRDLLHGMELAGYTPPQQTLIACAVSFHRKKVKPAEESLFTALTPAQRRHTLALAALLRLADGLAQSGITDLTRVVITPNAVTLRLAGPEATRDAAYMLKKADLWEEIFHLRIQVVVKTPPPDLAHWATLPLDLDTPVHQAARRGLAMALQHWQANQTQALAGDSAALEAVHTSAVALRLTLKQLARCFNPRAAQRWNKSLRKIERALKQARHTRRWLAEAEAHKAELGKEAGAAHLLATCKKQHAAATEAAIAALSGNRAADLHAALTDLLVAEPAGGNETLRQSAPATFEALLAEIAEREKALTRETPKSYTRLGNSIRRCRSMLELFAPALPAEAVQPLLVDLAHLQTHLEALDGQRRLQKRLALFLDDWARQQAEHKAPQLHDAHSVLNYAHDQRDAWETAVRALKPVLAPLSPARLRQRLHALLRP